MIFLFSICDPKRLTLNAQDSTLTWRFAFAEPCESWFASPIQEAESKAPERQRTPKRRRESDVEMVVTFWSAAPPRPLFRAFESHAAVAESSA
jgi:hypothetical protein